MAGWDYRAGLSFASPVPVLDSDPPRLPTIRRGSQLVLGGRKGTLSATLGLKWRTNCLRHRVRRLGYTFECGDYPFFVPNPMSARTILRQIVESRVQNVVFLSGDIHCCNVAEMHFTGGTVHPDTSRIRVQVFDSRGNIVFPDDSMLDPFQPTQYLELGQW